MSTDLLPPLPESGLMSSPSSQTVMTFSGNGFFGYSPCSTSPTHVSKNHLIDDKILAPGPRGIWWSTFTREDPDTRNVDNEEIRKSLRKRHSDWKDDSIRKIVESTDLEVKVATWVMPKAPTWAGKRIILVGDAAHCTFSFVGVSSSGHLIYTI